MTNPSLSPNDSPRRPTRNPSDSTGPLVAIILLVYASGLALSVYLATHGKEELGIGGTLLVLALAPVAFSLALGAGRSRHRQLIDRVEELTRLLRSFTDLASLSEDARRVLNRQNDRELLTQAIEEDITNKNWDAAMVLVKELAERFGYRSDAEEFRRKIDLVRAETIDKDITEAIAYLDGLIIQRKWDSAYSDAAKLLRLYPDSSRVFGLRGRVEQAHKSYKSDLERRLLVAAQDGKTEDAMSLLKELDGYLSPNEAEPLRELARGVIGKARENLGAQFKLAVQDRNWREASRIGERIIADFPNSRMAAEVRDLIDGIRIRGNSMN